MDFGLEAVPSRRQVDVEYHGNYGPGGSTFTAKSVYTEPGNATRGQEGATFQTRLLLIACSFRGRVFPKGARARLYGLPALPG
ncbi:hypothetical protein C5O80_15150 [Burkholderia sp. SRS-46]|nr:hypothetical protein C5O80_15150 [Burkholderia sp. SRS-46]